METFIIDTLIPVTAWIVLGSFALLLVFILIGFLNPANKFKGLIGTLILLGLAFGVYAMTSGEIPTEFTVKKYSYLTEGVYKYISASVWVSIILIAAGALLWVVMEAINLGK